MKLSSLVSNVPGLVPKKFPEIIVTGITLDSRKVQPGDIFVALTGSITDGHTYIQEAIKKGAVAVVGEKAHSKLSVPYIKVEDSHHALAHLSAAFWGYPARRMTMIGVTGTDGKTTTSNLIYHILQAAGFECGMISTVKASIGSKTLDTGYHVTTPESPDIQRYLTQMVSAGLTHVVLETTSHGLVQERVTACEFDVGVITNITHEHLDYHGTYEVYRAAKALLFTSLSLTAPKQEETPRVAVVNRDDSSYDYLASLIRPFGPQVHQISYGLDNEADVRAEDIISDRQGLKFTAVGPDFRIAIESNLIGDYNIMNCLAAIASTVAGLKIDLEAAREGIYLMRGIPGRMEHQDFGQDFLAIVDFAHTPNALRNALQTARKMTRGKVIAVFGSAGLRDREKRRMMAKISVELADYSVLTAEDPRTESVDTILLEMAAGAESRGGIEGKSYWKVPDRRTAIRFGISLARPRDVVIVCGKGHEQSMCFGETEYPWDDRIAMQAALAEHLCIPGPSMPYLPTQ